MVNDDLLSCALTHSSRPGGDDEHGEGSRMTALDAKELLGKHVQVKRAKSVIITGTLLSVTDQEYTIQDLDGQIHYCWTQLDVSPA
jgi:hypothetical protein